MAFDGIVISNIVKELNDTIVGGRIGKVTQPEKDEIILTVRNHRTNYKLLLSSMASMPRLHLTDTNKTNPITALNYCMLLRKHLIGGLILSITQPNFERIVVIEIQNLDEMGETCYRKLIIEVMGRHSNIILTDEQDMILDSIKRIGAQVSSVREVFPNRPYVFPPNQGKANPLSIRDFDAFLQIIRGQEALQQALYKNITGFSPQMAEEICFRAGLNGSTVVDDLNLEQIQSVYDVYTLLIQAIEKGDYAPTMVLDASGKQIAFSAFPIRFYQNESLVPYDSVSAMVEHFYLNNAIQSRISQKSVDLRKLVQTNLERCYKKLNLQLQQLKDTEDRDKYKIVGELIHANLYQIKEGDTEVTVLDYYHENQPRTITLDPRLTPSQNANKQYEKYNKKKRTLAALSEHIKATKGEIEHLESVKYALANALREEDLLEVRQELMETGYLKFRRSKSKKALQKAEPMHFRSSLGHDIYVGKNNYQNDLLATKLSNGGDWWFHAKDIPGSHVIVKADGQELPDVVYEEAAGLAAYFSKDRESPKVSVDYTLKKNLKKPNGSAPGYVIYHTNFSLMVAPSLKGVTLVKD
ncbi:Rqc2 family fibronectin-binding protein [Petrocella sp. FN5]|uniref:Rqc2 family fibronectin-binding protein n=1 Tax=Petrocella sp. FN5 TaxID=3032002 RepID=UPI0023DB7158|nr:NFACT RNA binding domain-containing protein [Petrocella sp. FN5]MDF1616988.1 NFACT RNA binding domain-containing protein [Petrocella sp. FN5]